MIYVLKYKDGKIKEMEREGLEKWFSIPKDWKFGMIKDFMDKFNHIKITEQDNREQAIYARMAKVKRPKPKEFKVGARVKVIDSILRPRWIGKLGTICAPLSKDGLCGINFDEDVGGHDCGELCEFGHGYWMLPKEAELI